MQAWRGTASHFNVGTPARRGVCRTVMGLTIVGQTTIASVAVAAALWRRALSPIVRWAGRFAFGLTITDRRRVVRRAHGQAPTDAQLARSARGAGRMTVRGHTVAGPMARRSSGQRAGACTRRSTRAHFWVSTQCRRCRVRLAFQRRREDAGSLRLRRRRATRRCSACALAGASRDTDRPPDS